jgi:uncharacterized protein (DUF4415 family)
MNGKDDASGSDLAKIDAYELSESDYAEVPELTDAWFAKAVPHRGGKPRGRPKAASPRQAVSLRLSQRVIEDFRAGGPGWQTRINAVLEDWLDRKGERG